LALLRATQFFTGTPPAPASGNLFTNEYTVPAGHRIALKSVHMSNPGASNKLGALNVDGVRQISSPVIGPSSQWDWNGWIVFNTPQVISLLQQSGGTVAYVLSGYLFFV
jgi:hypothetical protein